MPEDNKPAGVINLVSNGNDYVAQPIGRTMAPEANEYVAQPIGRTMAPEANDYVAQPIGRTMAPDGKEYVAQAIGTTMAPNMTLRPVEFEKTIGVGNDGGYRQSPPPQSTLQPEPQGTLQPMPQNTMAPVIKTMEPVPSSINDNYKGKDETKSHDGGMPVEGTLTPKSAWEDWGTPVESTQQAKSGWDSWGTPVEKTQQPKPVEETQTESTLTPRSAWEDWGEPVNSNNNSAENTANKESDEARAAREKMENTPQTITTFERDPETGEIKIKTTKNQDYEDAQREYYEIVERDSRANQNNQSTTNDGTKTQSNTPSSNFQLQEKQESYYPQFKAVHEKISGADFSNKANELRSTVLSLQERVGSVTADMEGWEGNSKVCMNDAILSIRGKLLVTMNNINNALIPACNACDTLDEKLTTLEQEDEKLKELIDDSKEKEIIYNTLYSEWEKMPDTLTDRVASGTNDDGSTKYTTITKDNDEKKDKWVKVCDAKYAWDKALEYVDCQQRREEELCQEIIDLISSIEQLENSIEKLNSYISSSGTNYNKISNSENIKSYYDEIVEDFNSTNLNYAKKYKEGEVIALDDSYGNLYKVQKLDSNSIQLSNIDENKVGSGTSTNVDNNPRTSDPVPNDVTKVGSGTSTNVDNNPRTSDPVPNDVTKVGNGETTKVDNGYRTSNPVPSDGPKVGSGETKKVDNEYRTSTPTADDGQKVGSGEPKKVQEPEYHEPEEIPEESKIHAPADGNTSVSGEAEYGRVPFAIYDYN
jgi:hypothetical protein